MITALSYQSDVWLQELANCIYDPLILLQQLDLMEYKDQLWLDAPFSCQVSSSFLARMRPKSWNDPLLQQVLPLQKEALVVPEYSCDPLKEREQLQGAFIKKYAGRALLVTKSSCASHCRYCFRKHFPYPKANTMQNYWDEALRCLQLDTSIREVILSGGDPLTSSDDELQELLSALHSISHLQRIRIHSRFPIFIPSRLTEKLAVICAGSQLPITLVLQVNHPQELDEQLICKLQWFRKRSGVVLLNQSVLLGGINDQVEILTMLSERLLKAGVIPYYIHLLDQVQGAAHFAVSKRRAVDLQTKLQATLSGFLVPRFVYETVDIRQKIPLRLSLSTQDSSWR